MVGFVYLVWSNASLKAIVIKNTIGNDYMYVLNPECKQLV
ncbi:hypothetical protein JCM19240_991 [Vibrio maritimus]|uniref:Uncharacterized protein n=1 Tax=Vibrio maritimus TaxID=990268 RepID=A0A090T4F9_9VIBR|nr:hypothetical protein JCM19240_991 [Vibrio maritimus]